MDFALKQEFKEDYKEDYEGRRTKEGFRFEGIKEEFEIHINRRIVNWSNYKENGCFQLCIEGDQILYNSCLHSYAAIIFLTPDAPPETSTHLYRSKITDENGLSDQTQFDLVDKIGNVYNRLVIFDAKLINLVSCYFENKDNNCRLFQIFFFDIEE